jgi:hypothetical protein
LAKECTEKLLKREITEYKNADGVCKIGDIGMAFFEIEGNEELRQKYYSKALSSLDIARQIFHPYLSPLDKLRLEISDRWPGGSALMNIGEGKMFTGLIRVLSGDVLPHEDKLERDSGITQESIDYIGQIAANIYLQVPKSGGALQLWDKTCEDEEYDALRGNSYGITRDRLPPPAMTIMPEAGELILFNPRNLHAVTPSPKGDLPRVSYSTFLCYGGEDKPIRFWS